MIFYLHYNALDDNERFYIAFTPEWFSNEGEPDGYMRIKTFGSFTWLAFEDRGQGRLEPLEGCTIARA